MNHMLSKIEKLLAEGKRLLIYGNAHTAVSVCRLLVDHGFVPSSFVVDRFAFVPGSRLEGIDVVCMEDIRNKEDYIWVIGFDNPSRTQEIIHTFPNVIHFVDLDGKSSWSDEFLESHKDDLDMITGLLEDDRSRETLRAIIHARNTGEYLKLLDIAEPVQYFNPLTRKNGKGEVFLDCGAFVGDTVLEYVSFNPDYKSIYAFEPMKENFSKLKNNTVGIRDFQLVSKGVWDTDTQLCFHEDTSASSVADSGEIRIETVAIDNLMPEDLEAPVFIKMDVEGAEYEALLGARQTIERVVPKMAICVYHKNEDIMDLFKLIYSFESGKKYKYYLRHHSNRLSETVLYAIPDDDKFGVNK